MKPDPYNNSHTKYHTQSQTHVHALTHLDHKHIQVVADHK